MGLGKTIQVLGLLSLSRGNREPGTDLLVVPASIVDNWRLEIERFAPQLKVLIAHPSHIPSPELKRLSRRAVDAHDAVITTYGTVMRTAWMRSHTWRNVVLDEAQAIKNPGAKQTKAIKTLDSRWRLALTGTPVENRLGDLWSIFDFLNPGLLGSAKAFNRFCKSMESGTHGGYAPLRRLVQPYVLRRLKTDKSVIADLPDKTEVTAHCLLSKRQAALYTQSVEAMKTTIEAVDGIERRGVVLAFLTRFKQICNHPSQWLGDGSYAAADSGKLTRLGELGESIASRQDKVLVFTQFREMTAPLSRFLTEGLRSPRPRAPRRYVSQETAGAGPELSGGRPSAVHGAIDQGGGHRAQPDRRVPCHPLRPVVEPGGREPGNGPRLSHRPAEERARPQVRLPGHGGGAY